MRAAATLVFTEKLGVLPEHVFEVMFNDRLVAKGTVLWTITDIFKTYIERRDADELISLLTRAKVVGRLLEYFPPGQQTPEAFEAHFRKHGLEKIVRFRSRGMLRSLSRGPAVSALLSHIPWLAC